MTGSLAPHRHRQRRQEGIPRWVLLLHGLAGGAMALTWLLTLPWQLQLIADAGQWVRP